jgi:hypothetical protein
VTWWCASPLSRLRRILALVEVEFSNSIIEALNPDSTWNRLAEEDSAA